jgi:hypothetical protein
MKLWNEGGNLLSEGNLEEKAWKNLISTFSSCHDSNIILSYWSSPLNAPSSALRCWHFWVFTSHPRRLVAGWPDHTECTSLESFSEAKKRCLLKRISQEVHVWDLHHITQQPQSYHEMASKKSKNISTKSQTSQPVNLNINRMLLFVERWLVESNCT